MFMLMLYLQIRTQTEGSQKDLQKQREQLEAALMRILEGNNTINTNAGTVQTNAGASGGGLRSSQPKLKTRQQELQEMGKCYQLPHHLRSLTTLMDTRKGL